VLSVSGSARKSFLVRKCSRSKSALLGSWLSVANDSALASSLLTRKPLCAAHSWLADTGLPAYYLASRVAHLLIEQAVDEVTHHQRARGFIGQKILEQRQLGVGAVALGALG
jgi:hypothetical protein